MKLFKNLNQNKNIYKIILFINIYIQSNINL